MTCDTNCGLSPCTSAQRGGLITSNLVISPQNPTAGSSFSITVDVTNNNPQNSFTDICIFDRDTGRCVMDTGFSWISPLATHSYGPITLTMPNHPYNLQVATREQEIYGILYYCGDYQNITITPYNPPGTTYGCNPNTGYCEPGYGSFTDPNCSGTCTGGGGRGFGTCSPACSPNDLCVMGLCLPKPIVLIGVAALLYSFLRK